MRRFVVVASVLAGLAFGLALTVALPALATVLTPTLEVEYTPSSPTSTFTITFPFLEPAHIVVVKTEIATDTPTTLVQGTGCANCYTVHRLPNGSGGSITVASPIGNTHTLKIRRDVPPTQPTSFRSQGTFNPGAIENAFDRVIMLIQQLAAGTLSSGDVSAAIAAHEGASDPHTAYVKQFGRAGGQFVFGGTLPDNNLYLYSTIDDDRGTIVIGNAMTIFEDESLVTVYPRTEFSDEVCFAGSGLCITTDTSSGTFDGIYKMADTSYLVLSGGTDYTSNAAIILSGPSTVVDPDQIWVNADEVKFGDEDGFSRWTINDSGLTGASGMNVELASNAYVRASALYGSSSSAGDLLIESTSHMTKGIITVGRMKVRGDTPGDDGEDVHVDGDVVVRDSWLAALRRVVDARSNITVDCGGNAGAIYEADKATIISLPEDDSTRHGCQITVTYMEADAGTSIILRPQGDQSIFGACISGAGYKQLTGTPGKDVESSKSAAARGDSVTMHMGTDGQWYVTSCFGGWASEDDT